MTTHPTDAAIEAAKRRVREILEPFYEETERTGGTSYGGMVNALANELAPHLSAPAAGLSEDERKLVAKAHLHAVSPLVADLLAIIDRLAASPAASGTVPARETFWLVERKVQPPQYCVEGYTDLPSLTSDPWRAARFATEREAFDYRLRLWSLRDECKETEHVFINKPDPAGPPATRRDEPAPEGERG